MSGLVAETAASLGIQWCLTLAWGCPVVDCDFHPPPVTLTAPTDDEEDAATVERNAVIAEHAEIHTTAEWLRTIQHLKDQAEEDE